MTDYEQYRGKCKELAEQWVAEHAEYTLVRGSYFCPIWNREEAHWWTTAPDGSIHDPSAKQFPSKGLGLYTPFDGYLECAECGQLIEETDAIGYGNYAFCSGGCVSRFVGV